MGGRPPKFIYWGTTVYALISWTTAYTAPLYAPYGSVTDGICPEDIQSLLLWRFSLPCRHIFHWAVLNLGTPVLSADQSLHWGKLSELIASHKLKYVWL
jgi:hypothetical protein